MWLGIAIFVGLFTWAILGMAALGTMPKDIAKHFDDPVERVAWFVRGLAVLLTIVGIVSYFSAENFLHDFSAEMVGIGLGVWGIDELNRWRSMQEYKRGIIRQMASRSNDFALDAARVAKDEGWLRDGSLVGASLLQANLERADLELINLEGANLVQGNLMEANFSEAKLARAFLFAANLEGANFGGADLAGAALWGANLTRADLDGANLARANLVEANLAQAFLFEANLAGADLVEANLEGAILWEANLAEVDLRHANLERADLVQADLTEALYDNATRWPDDFDPKSEGAINWDELSAQKREEWLKQYRPKQQ